MFCRNLYFKKNSILSVLRYNSYLANHIGVNKNYFLKKLNYKSEEDFLQDVYPKYKNFPIDIPSKTFPTIKKELDLMGNKNIQMKTMKGNGFYNSFPIQHLVQNFLLNPNFYSAYIPYQSEISQGRLELLYNYQTMICNLTNMDIANCSLLDESSACAEAMNSLYNYVNKKHKDPDVIIDSNIFQQHKSVLKTRSEFSNIMMDELDIQKYIEKCLPLSNNSIAIFQMQNKNGNLINLKKTIEYLKEYNVYTIVLCDPLALSMYEPPGTYGADFVVGSTQKFGLPMWNGGPHAAFLSARQEYLRFMPGRLVGKTKDAFDNDCFRLALQAREQHIKKDKALSNICTSQALLANYNVLYAMTKGPDEIRNIAFDIYKKTKTFKQILEQHANNSFIEVLDTKSFDSILLCHKIIDFNKKESHTFSNNYFLDFDYSTNEIKLTFDETTDFETMESLLKDEFYIFHIDKEQIKQIYDSIDVINMRKSKLLTQDIFNDYNSEHKITRYINKLQKKDISLTHSMIPLGSCTMKLNSADVLSSLTNPSWGNIHPYLPEKYQRGYNELIHNMENNIKKITGLDCVSFQSNSGATGEYSALCSIKKYFENQGDVRDVCIIPDSAHGTNFASAKLAGYKVVKIKSNKNGSINQTHLNEILEKHGTNIACFMITFPSTFGFFEDDAEYIITRVKKLGTKIYCDGANMNAFMGIVNLKEIGMDACHLNLHKTFTIPHGGGGPGLGPIAVTEELREFLPKNPVLNKKNTENTENTKSLSYGSISSAPNSSASLLTIPYTYMNLCGGEGLQQCSLNALLSANYMKKRLEPHFKIPFTNSKNMVSHEFIIDVSEFKPITEKEIAKRLMDYGFHAPTMSWPVPHSLMIEPTESEDIEQLDNFVDALISIKKEIQEIHKNENFDNNLLVNAPHSINLLYEKEWKYDYSKEEAYFPLDYIRKNKFNVPISLVQDAFGDRILILKD